MSSSNIIKFPSLRRTTVAIGSGGPCFVPPASGEAAGAGVASECAPCGAAEADDIIARAQSGAEDIIAAAVSRAEELAKEAFEKGFQRGHAEGMESAHRELAAQTKRIAEMANAVVVERSSILRTAESELVQLALAIAERVVHKQLAVDKSLVISLVRGALEYVDSLDVVRIRVNPSDIEVLQAQWDELGLSRSNHSVELVPDLRVQAGGCIVDTKGAVVDAQLETKLAEIERAFRSELPTEGEGQ